MPDYAYLVQMDIPAEHEADFNRVYDTEHARYITNAPGVHSCDRFLLKSTNAPKFARYAALYGIDDPGVPTSAGWQVESEKGDWATKIRPHAIQPHPYHPQAHRRRRRRVRRCRLSLHRADRHRRGG